MPLPALAHPRGGGPEVAVELARAVDGPDDRVERDHLLAEAALADAAEGAGDLLEREDVVHVVDSTQPGGQSREGAPATGAAEVELSVGARQARVPGHHPRVLREEAATERARVVAFAAASAAQTRDPHAHAVPGPKPAPGLARNGHRDEPCSRAPAGSPGRCAPRMLTDARARSDEAVLVGAAHTHDDPAGGERMLARGDSRKRVVAASRRRERGRRTCPPQPAGLLEVGLVAGAVLRGGPLHVGDPAPRSCSASAAGSGRSPQRGAGARTSPCR